MNVTTLLDQYDVDRAHARHVADLALKLFDESRPLHAMSKRARRLLEVGALLHNVGMHVDEEQHHIAGRDIVLDEPLADLDEDERAVVACLVMFHRKKVRAHLEPAFLRLGRKDRQMVLRLAAILRIADGLDYSETQTSRINALRITDEQTILHLDVPHMADDLKRANRKADLWRKVLNPSLELIADTPTPDAVAAMAFENGTVAFIAPHTIRLDDVEASTDRATLEEVDTPAAPDLAPVEPAGKPAIRPTFTAQDRLADLGRRLLRTYFQQLLIEEKGVQAGDTPEPVHKMRVATRRLRAIMQIIRPVAPERAVRYFRKELRLLAQALAPMRDTDVLLGRVLRYQEGQPEDAPIDLSSLIDTLRSDREAAYRDAMTYFDSTRYTDFKRDFAAFMTAPPNDWAMHVRVRDIAGSLIWQNYEALRAYEAHIDTSAEMEPQSVTLHEARIEGKRLRYVLEMFAPLFGDQADRTLKPLVALQEHLGALQDIAVAHGYIERLQERTGELEPDVVAYAATRTAESATLFTEVPQRWERICGETYRRDLARLLVRM